MSIFIIHWYSKFNIYGVCLYGWRCYYVNTNSYIWGILWITNANATILQQSTPELCLYFVTSLSWKTNGTDLICLLMDPLSTSHLHFIVPMTRLWLSVVISSCYLGLYWCQGYREGFLHRTKKIFVFYSTPLSRSKGAFLGLWGSKTCQSHTCKKLKLDTFYNKPISKCYSVLDVLPL